MAQEMFGQMAETAPHDGAPKVGYSLAAALKGNDDTAIWAMRRAFRIDPSGSYALIFSDRVQASLEKLVYHFRESAGDHVRESDSWFMVAAVSHFLNKNLAARKALNAAVRAGDHAQSTENLRSRLPSI